MRCIVVNFGSPVKLDTGPGTAYGRIGLLIATIQL